MLYPQQATYTLDTKFKVKLRKRKNLGRELK
jgi:hypothetical protein